MRNLAICAVLLLAACNPLEWFWRSNPNLTLLMSENEEGNWGASLFAPVWSPDGRSIYFLRSQDTCIPMFEISGDLWTATADGCSARMLTAGPFFALDVSSDGSMLATVMGLGSRDGTGLAIFYLETGQVDTLPTAHEQVFDLAFGKADTARIYYSAERDGIWSIRLDGSDGRSERRSAKYFDLTESDSIVTLLPDWSIGTKPSVHPDGRYVASSAIIDPDEVWVLDMETGEEWKLNANPYYWSYIHMPNWSPDGERLVFAVVEQTNRANPTQGAELWVLEDVFE